jgi:hypothetical protein
VCQADVDTICEEEGRRVQDVRWPQIEISSEKLCEIVKKGVVKYTNTYLRMADEAWEEKKAKWIRDQEAEAEAARRRQAARSQVATRNFSFPEIFGRLRNKTQLQKPER